MGARYTLGVRYLYIERNVEKVRGACYTSVRVIYRKIRYVKVYYQQFSQTPEHKINYSYTFQLFFIVICRGWMAIMAKTHREALLFRNL
jgi:hypothetical protein